MITAFLNQSQLAKRWHISIRTLEAWRWQNSGPDYLKIRGRVLYRLEDIEAFERASQHQTAPAQERRRGHRKQTSPIFEKRSLNLGSDSHG